eukprot:1161894-Pelagomonas_calceolata.AAC.4
MQGMSGKCREMSAKCRECQGNAGNVRGMQGMSGNVWIAEGKCGFDVHTERQLTFEHSPFTRSQ